MPLRTVTAYVREIKPRIEVAAFAPARSRLWWLPLHGALITLLTILLAQQRVPWVLAPLVSLAIGVSFAGLTFLAHETLHGAVLHGRHLPKLIGWLGFLPFAISPRLWQVWHNRIHHGHTQHAGLDPDAYPTLDEYGHSRAVRVATDYGAPGRRRLRGILALLIGFSVQSTHMLVVARKEGFLPPRQHALAVTETLLGVALWLALALVIGPLPFLFAFGLPLLVANTIVMAHILTNHSLSPLTPVNDPLANSLSVTVPRAVEWLTLGFGFHVEHHLFPGMSARHAAKVRDVLRARWPERYQSMPLYRALYELYRSPRVYKDPNTLIDPRSGSEWPALGPR